MKLDIDFKWTEKNVIPPRCRKPRDVMHDDGRVTVVIAEVGEADAPVAITEQETYYVHSQVRPAVEGGWPSSGSTRSQRTKSYRWWNDRLMEPMWRPEWTKTGPIEHTQVEAPVTSMDSKWIEGLLRDIMGWGHRTLEESTRTAQRFAAEHVFIGNVLYEPATEPMYRLSIHHWGRHSIAIFADHNDRGENDKRDLYRADQYDVALARATEMRDRFAMAYGDDFEFDVEPTLTVLMPEVLRQNPQEEAKADQVRREQQRTQEAIDNAIENVANAQKAVNTASAYEGGTGLSTELRRADLTAATKALTAARESLLKARDKF